MLPDSKGLLGSAPNVNKPANTWRRSYRTSFAGGRMERSSAGKKHRVRHLSLRSLPLPLAPVQESVQECNLTIPNISLCHQLTKSAYKFKQLDAFVEEMKGYIGRGECPPVLSGRIVCGPKSKSLRMASLEIYAGKTSTETRSQANL